MRKKTIVLILVVFMLLNVTSIGMFFTTGTNTNTLPNDQPIKADPKFRNIELSYKIDDLAAVSPVSSSSSLKTANVVGDVRIYATLDFNQGIGIFTWFKLRYITDGVEIWTRCYSDGSDNFYWPEGDPRATPVVTDEQIEYLAGEFDNNIYPTDTDYFGMPDFHDGVLDPGEGAKGILPEGYWPYLPDPDPTGRSVILVSNLIDENYVDPDYPYFVIGVFSPTVEGWFDRNIISIDANHWDEYVGGEGGEYEGTIAHEFQHLIHDDYFEVKATFMNEGCSMYAEVLCGYPASWGHINSFMFTPDNSLVDWGDQGDINILADYGQVLLWCIYLTDHYGSDFLKMYVTNGVPGIEGINDILPKWTNFDKVFHDWRLANLIHSGYGKYNYKSIDLTDGDPINIHDLSGGTIPWTNAAEGFGNTFTILGFDTGVSKIGPYGTDYISMNDLMGLNVLTFKGDTMISTDVFESWIWEDGYWYSGATDLRNVLLGAEVYVDPADPWLNLTTYWDIEDYWDFGFVQVSTDGGTYESTWTSLENEYTTYDHDPNAHPDVVANLPGLTSWSGFLPEGPVVSMLFDLSAYAGQTINLGFRYVTDWGFLYYGWDLYHVVVSGTDYLEQLAPVFPEIPVNWMVTLVEQKTLSNGKVKYSIHDMHVWEWFSNWAFSLTSLKANEDLILLISPMMASHKADYGFSATPLHFRHH